ncbi:MAG TPA: hypothetical protein VM253_11230 [Candidatus Limnocylindrales bacterium]|nr:hypothetical protein [Candidatus Limnocylindrales bacterium]
MIGRIFGDRRTRQTLRRIDRPAAAGLALAQALVAAVGWFVEPVWLAVAVAVQLALGGIGAVRVLGPARPELGLARYAMPAAAGIAVTLVGRLVPGGISLLLVPIVAVLLWTVTYLELRVEQGTGGRTIGDLLLTGVLIAATWGVLELFGPRAWPTPVIVVSMFALPLGLRGAEARGALGAEAFGQALLQVLVVAQVTAASVLLTMPVYGMAAITGLAFYAWGGAVEALRGGASGRSVAVEFGTLMLVGLVAGLLLHRS